MYSQNTVTRLTEAQDYPTGKSNNSKVEKGSYYVSPRKTMYMENGFLDN